MEMAVDAVEGHEADMGGLLVCVCGAGRWEHKEQKP